MADEELRLSIRGEDNFTPVLQKYQASLGQAQAATQAFGQASAATAGQHAQAAAATTTAAQSLTSHTAAARQAETATVSLGTALGGLPGPAGAAATSFRGLHTELSQANVQLLAVGTGMAVAGAAIGVGLAAATHEAAEYQRAMADVQVVSNATGAEMAQLSQKAMELGVATQFNSKQVAAGLYELSSAGLTVTETLTAIEPVTRMAMLGQLNLGAATKDVVGVMRQFGIDSSQVGKLVDLETVAVQGSVLHWNELGEAYRNIGGRAHSMGISVEESTAALMIMSNAGITAASAGTALGTFIDRIAKGTGEAGAAIEQMGLHLYDASGKFVGLAPLLDEIAAKTAGMTDAEKNHELSMLAGSRASGFLRNVLAAQAQATKDGVDVTYSGVDALRHYTEELQNSAGASQHAADIIEKTLDQKMKELSGSIGEAQIKLGQQFLPVVSAAVPEVMGLVNAFVQADPAVQAATAAFLGVGAAGLVVVGGLTAVGVALPLVTAGLAAVGIAAGPAIIAVGGVALASAALAAAWSSDWGDIREHATDAQQNIQATATQMKSDQDELATYLNREVVPKWRAFWGDIQRPAAPTGPVGDTAFPQGPPLTVFGPPAPQDLGIEGQDVFRTGRNVLTADERGLGPLGDVKGTFETGWEDIKASNAAHAAAVADDLAQQYSSQLLRRRPMMHAAGAELGDALDTGIQDGIEQAAAPVISAVDAIFARIQANSKDSPFKLTTELAGATDEQYIADLLATQDAIKTVDGAIGQLTDRTLAAHIVALRNTGQETEAEALASAHMAAQAQSQADAHAMVTAAHQAETVASREAKTATEAHTTAITAETAAHRELKASVDETTLAADILEQRFASLVSSTLPQLSAELAGQVQAQENANGAQAAANLLLDQGKITLEQYAAATDGAAASTRRHTRAVDEHKQALDEMLKSTDAWTVSQGLQEQLLDNFVNGELAKLPLGIRAVAAAQKNANDELGAATTIGNYYGIGLDLIQMKLAGDVSAQNQFTDAVKRTNDTLANAAVGHTGLGYSTSGGLASVAGLSAAAAANAGTSVGTSLGNGIAQGVRVTEGAVTSAVSAVVAAAGKLAMPVNPYDTGALFGELAKEGAFPKTPSSILWEDPNIAALAYGTNRNSAGPDLTGMGHFGASITGSGKTKLGLGGSTLTPEMGDDLAGPYTALGTAITQTTTSQQNLTTATRNSTGALGQGSSAAHTMASAYATLGASANAARTASEALAQSEAASAAARKQQAADLLASTQTIGGFKVAAPTTTTNGNANTGSNPYSGSSTSGWASAYNIYTAGGIPHFAAGGYAPRPMLAVVGDSPGGEYMVPAGAAGRMGGGTNVYVTLQVNTALLTATNLDLQRLAQQLGPHVQRVLAGR